MRAVFSATITLVLLSIYVYLALRGVQVVLGSGAEFTDRMASTLTLIGGLVSALVIAELSITQPGEAPAARLVTADTAKNRKGLMQIVTGMYLLVWLVTGLLAFLVGFLNSGPEVLPVLSDLGQSWLGIAVGAGYAYFGIKQ